MSAWDELKRDEVLRGERFSIQRSDLELADGTVGEGWHWIQFHMPAVGVVAVREDGAILLIDHFRFTTRTRDWEIPAGAIDEGETPEDAARREVREETGHAVGTLDLLGHYHPS